MLARVARYEVEAERIDDAVRVFGEAATEIEGLAGFAGGFVFVDQEDGRTMTVTPGITRRRSRTASRPRDAPGAKPPRPWAAPCCRSRSSRLRTSSARAASSATPPSTNSP